MLLADMDTQQSTALFRNEISCSVDYLAIDWFYVNFVNNANVFPFV